jgi:hypothetical protein
MLIILIGLVAAHPIVFYLLPHMGMSRAGVSGAVLSGVVLLVIAKHLGLFAALLRPIYGLFRRRFPSGRRED